MYGTGWKARQKANQERKEALNDPETLERRKEVQARQEAERALQIRLAAETEARRKSEFVVFPPMPVKQAAEIILAYERYRTAGREAVPAETEALSRMVQGLPALPASPTVRLTYGLEAPVSVSGAVAPQAEPMALQTAPDALDNASRKPTRTKTQPDVLLDGQFLIED